MTHLENLGKTARDKINDFEGTITGVAFYLTGCAQYLIEGKVVEGETRTLWSDEDRVEVEEMEPVVVRTTDETKGGPQPNAPKPRGLR